MNARRPLFPLMTVLGGVFVLASATPAHAQFPPAYGGWARGFMFQGVNRFQGNPYAQANLQWQTFSRVANSGVGFYGNAYLYQFTGFYRPASVRYPSVEPGTSLGSGFGGNGKVVAAQRAAIADAQRNAKWDKGATDNLPDFDKWLKDAAASRATPTGKPQVIDPVLVDPPEAAILSGEVLNHLAALIRDLEKAGKKGTPGLLAPELTSKIVFAGGPAADAANVFRTTELKFPEAMQDKAFADVRAELEKSFAAVAKDTREGKKTTPADVDRLLRAVAKASAAVRKVVADAPVGEACEVCEFLTELDTAARFLKTPKSTGVAGADWSAVGATVAEVVRHEVQFGIRFGPARPGDEAAYFTLHRGLLAYAAALSQAK